MKQSTVIEFTRFTTSMGKKTVSVILKCSKCGKLDKTEVSNQ